MGRPINSALEMSTHKIRKRSNYQRRKNTAPYTPACVKLESVIKHRILRDLNKEFSAIKTKSSRKQNKKITTKLDQFNFESKFDNDEVTKIRNESSYIYNELNKRLNLLSHI